MRKPTGSPEGIEKETTEDALHTEEGSCNLVTWHEADVLIRLEIALDLRTGTGKTEKLTLTAYLARARVAYEHSYKELSRNLGIQFIMVNHLALLNEYADTSLMVEKIDGVSVVKNI